MHNLVKHIVKNIGISLFLLISVLITTQAYSEQSAEDIIKVSPLNNFLKIPEIVIDKIVTYNNTWLSCAKILCPLKILGSSFGVGLIILIINLRITK